MLPAALVLDPEVTARPRDGRVALRASGATQGFVADNPGLVAWIFGFARPRDPAQVLAALPAAERAGAQQLLERLVALGILRAPAAPSASLDPAAAQAAQALALQQVGQLVQCVYALAGELRGFGPAAAVQQPELNARLGAALAGLEGLLADFAARRKPFVAAQVESLGELARGTGLKLHIGAGGANLPGWVNIDVHPAPLSMSLDWGLPFADGSARFACLAHLLEHLWYPQQAQRLLGDIARVLAPGGVVRVVVPDIEQCIRAYADGDGEFFARRRDTWGWPEGQTRLEDFLAYAGAGPNPAYLFEAHKFGYDYETLSRALERSGFTQVRRCGYMASPHAELRVDDASAVAGAQHSGQHYSLFVEAIRS